MDICKKCGKEIPTEEDLAFLDSISAADREMGPGYSTEGRELEKYCIAEEHKDSWVAWCFNCWGGVYKDQPHTTEWHLVPEGEWWLITYHHRCLDHFWG